MPPRLTAPRPVETMTGLLDAICALAACEEAPDDDQGVPVRAILEVIGRRAYGPLLLAIGLFSISPLTAAPGLTWAAAALTLVIAGQLMVGLPRPWMPAPLLKATVSRRLLIRSVAALRPTAGVIDRFLRPRLSFLARPPWVLLVGALCAAAALATFPLGLLPLLPLGPGVAVVLFGLGLTARDGLLLSLGALAVGATFAVAAQLLS